MKTVCLVLSFRPMVAPDRLLGTRTVSQWISDALDSALPGVPRVPLGPWSSVSALVSDLASASEGYDEVVAVAADAPYLRVDETKVMLELHREYRADYTFADGFPGGMTPEIFRPGLLPLLKDWAAQKAAEVDRETLFQLLATDINRFDVETHLSPVDLRSRRLSLTADSLRNRLLLERYLADANLTTRSFLEVIEATTDRTRTLPATLHVQITNGVCQTPLWSPLLQFQPHALTQRDHLPRARWNQLLDTALAWAGDLTVIPSFWGEPSLHPEIVELLVDAAAKPGLKLCIETSGLGWKNVELESVAAQLQGRVDWIVELDSDVLETYRALRGEGFDEAHAFVTRIAGLFPGRVWPQTVRMGLNEAEMEGFYKRWNAELGRVIVQKHNDFGGRLPRLKPSDLSPWKRHACWHLARDLSVFLDGTVVVCRDDFQRSQVLGNVWKDSWSTVWAAGSALFGRHVQEDWPEVCRNCDEWYTYHF